MTGKISEDSDVGTLSGDEMIPIVADGTNARTTPDEIKAFVKAGLAKGDVGLGNVDNTADTAKAVLSATKLATGRAIDGVTFDGTAGITVIAPGTHAATSKATPVDADEIPLVDSAASNALKKLTWANLKATLLAAFFSNGTWTPELKFGGNNTGMTYTSNTGSYLRIFGKFVVFTGTIQLSAKGSSTGTAQITGIPVASDGSTAAASIAYFSGMTGLVGTLLLGLNVAAADIFSITQTGTAGASVLSDASFTNTGRIDFSGFYIAA